MNEVTRILFAIEGGDPHAAEQLLPLVYDELWRLAVQKRAQEKPGQTLEATALVHEAYLRLVGAGGDQHWENRRHFFAVAAERPQPCGHHRFPTVEQSPIRTSAQPYVAPPQSTQR
jgi:hypothetical protein